MSDKLPNLKVERSWKKWDRQDIY